MWMIKLYYLNREWVVSSHDGKLKKSIGKIYADMQVHNFNINAQPYYILLDHNGNLLTTPRAYDLDIDAFANFLKTGIENFKSWRTFLTKKSD